MDIYLLARSPYYFLYLDQLFLIVQIYRIFVCETSFQIVSEWVCGPNSLDQNFFHFSLEDFFRSCHVIVIKVQLGLTILHF